MVVGDIRMVLIGHLENREVTESMTVSICLGSFTKGQIFGEEGLDNKLVMSSSGSHQAWFLWCWRQKPQFCVC